MTVSKALIFKSFCWLPDKNQNAFHWPLFPLRAARGRGPLIFMHAKHSPTTGPLHLLWPLLGVPDPVAYGSQPYLSQGSRVSSSEAWRTGPA